jgi:uncharacterized membrane protein
MFKTKTTLLISLIFIGLFFVFTQKVRAEFIVDFNSTINVLPDSSLLVKEKISYDFEKSIKHGIFRSILLHNSKKEPIEIRVISVTDQNGKSYEFTESISDDFLILRIGDLNKMISGVKEYNISYQVFGSIGYYDDFDEIYWNVTGNEWSVPIESISATVVLPNNIFPIEQSCYYGEIGSNKNCKITESNTFVSNSVLNGKGGLTVAVSFPKGVVSTYQIKNQSKSIIIIKILWPILIPIFVFIFMFMKWWRFGRDSKGNGTIVPQYDVPEGLTPLEVGGIIKGKIANKNISAEIIYLAINGYIKIRQIDADCDNYLCLITKKDYEFTLLKEEGLLPNSFDQKIITAIFGEDGEVGGVSLLSELNNYLYKSIPEIDNAVVASLLNKKYYKNFPKIKIKNSSFVGVLIFGVFIVSEKFFNTKNNFSSFKTLLVLLASVFISFVIWIIFNRLMSAKTKKGVIMKEYLLGLKEYLQISEKDRLRFHNAPDKNPEIFEKLFPYAMVFGVEELWSKEFENIYNSQPEWYEGKSNFNINSFGHDMAVFNTMTTSTLSSTPSYSGAGGGGSSGGGGGGGGGGSW